MAPATPYAIVIKEHHVDSLGHMNNATYLALYEEARWEYVTERGYGFKVVQERQQGPVILEVNVKFLKEISLRERIYITTELVGYKGKIGQLVQKMVREDGSIANEALFTFGLFDLKLRKMIEPTAEWNKAVGAV